MKKQAKQAEPKVKETTSTILERYGIAQNDPRSYRGIPTLSPSPAQEIMPIGELTPRQYAGRYRVAEIGEAKIMETAIPIGFWHSDFQPDKPSWLVRFEELRSNTLRRRGIIETWPDARTIRQAMLHARALPIYADCKPSTAYPIADKPLIHSLSDGALQAAIRRLRPIPDPRPRTAAEAAEILDKMEGYDDICPNARLRRAYEIARKHRISTPDSCLTEREKNGLRNYLGSLLKERELPMVPQNRLVFVGRGGKAGNYEMRPISLTEQLGMISGDNAIAHHLASIRQSLKHCKLFSRLSDCATGKRGSQPVHVPTAGERTIRHLARYMRQHAIANRHGHIRQRIATLSDLWTALRDNVPMLPDSQDARRKPAIPVTRVAGLPVKVAARLICSYALSCWSNRNLRQVSSRKTFSAAEFRSRYDSGVVYAH